MRSNKKQVPPQRKPIFGSVDDIIEPNDAMRCAMEAQKRQDEKKKQQSCKGWSPTPWCEDGKPVIYIDKELSEGEIIDRARQVVASTISGDDNSPTGKFSVKISDSAFEPSKFQPGDYMRYIGDNDIKNAVFRKYCNALIRFGSRTCSVIEKPKRFEAEDIIKTSGYPAEPDTIMMLDEGFEIWRAMAGDQVVLRSDISQRFWVGEHITFQGSTFLTINRLDNSGSIPVGCPRIDDPYMPVLPVLGVTPKPRKLLKYKIIHGMGIGEIEQFSEGTKVLPEHFELLENRE